MKYRKMLLMNLLQGSNGDHRDRDQICGHGGGIGEWDELRVAWKHMHYHM